MSASLVVGRKAPAFSLPNQDGETVKLSSFKGRWVVLYFYPKDNTGGCTTEACEFTDSIKNFEKLDAVVLGCSPDAPASHQKFIAKFKLKLTLLCDEDHSVMDQYDAWGPKSLYGRKFMGVLRSTVIIDPQGNVAHLFPKVRSAGHAEAVRAKLVELRAAAA